MSSIEYHSPRLPDEAEIYEYRTHRAGAYKGSIYFEKENQNQLKEVCNDLHGTRKREDYLAKAARKLIRDKGFCKVEDKKGDNIAELKVNKYNDQ